MEILNQLFGFRWSLYISPEEKRVAYMLHENNVVCILGYVRHYFENGAEPQPPWSLHLNFNKRHQSFRLRPEYFEPDGSQVTQALMKKIEAIDPGWRVPHAEPTFVEASTKRQLPLSNAPTATSQSSGAELEEAVYRYFTQPRNEIDFYFVMDRVFGKTRT